jgi:hypothetical protein
MTVLDNVALSSWFLIVGVFFGFFANILVSRQSYKFKWMSLFYGLGVASLLCCLWAALSPSYHHRLAWIGCLISLVYIPALHIITHPKRRFTKQELTPKIIEWTDDADDDLLRLFFGDINCFGETPCAIDDDQQYQQLRRLRFRRLHILCERPTSQAQKVIYGKLLTDFNEAAEMKHYNKNGARDLGIRGRIKKCGEAKVDRVQLYKGIRIGGKKQWEPVEHDVQQADCALYVNIWNSLWDNADSSAATEVLEWKNLFSPAPVKCQTS